MGLRFDPTGGGIFKKAVASMIEAEKQPLNKLSNRKSLLQRRLRLFQDFKAKFSQATSSLQNIKDFKSFRELKAGLGDGEKLASVTIDQERAQPGRYTIEIAEMAQRTSIISNNFEDPDERLLGMGYVVADTPEGEYEIFIGEDDGSLNGVARAINRDPNSPLQASVIKDVYYEDAPYRLIVSSKSDGRNGSAGPAEFYFIDGEEDIWADEEADSENSLLYVDGFEIEAAGNDVEDFIEGVTLHIKKAAEYEPFVLTIEEDTQKIYGKVKETLDKVNEVLTFIQSQNKVDQDSDTREMFTGDSALQNIEFRIRNLFHNNFPVRDLGPNGNPEDVDLVDLHELGISIGRDGLIQINENKFNSILDNNFALVQQVVSGEQGLAVQLETVFQGYTNPLTGNLAMREKGMQNNIRRVDEQILDKQLQIDRKTQALVRRFSRLQASLADLQRQQQGFAATMGGRAQSIDQLLGGG